MTVPGETEKLLQLGIAAARAGRKEEASALLARVVERDERNEQAWLWLSGVLDSPDERRACLERVLAIHPNHAAALAGLRYLDRAAAGPTGDSAPPGFAPVQPSRAVESVEGEHEPAPGPGDVPSGERCPHCKKPLPMFGSDCPHCGGPLLVACPACGEYASIEQPVCGACGQSLGDYRQGTAYLMALAQASYDNGRLEAMQRALHHAMSRAAGDGPALEGIATLFERAGRLDEAADAGELAVAAAPQSAPAYVRLASIYQRRGETDPARDALRKAAGLSPDPTAQLELARLYMADEATVAEAAAMLARIVKAKPANAEAHLLLGDACLKQHDETRARRAYEEAARLAPADSQISLEARSRLAEYHAASQAGTSRRDLRGTGQAARRLGERPGCLSIYAAWLAFNGALLVLAALLLATMGATALAQFAAAGDLPSPDVPEQWLRLAAAFGFAVALAYLVVAFGLWSMKNWARIIVLMATILGLVVTVVETVISLVGTRGLVQQLGLEQLSGVFLCGPILEIAISGYIIFWFGANRELFS